MTDDNPGASPPIFKNEPFNKTVGIPLPLYDSYIRKALKNGMTVKQVHQELVTVGFLQRYETFAKYVRLKIKKVWSDSKKSAPENPDLNLPDNVTSNTNDDKLDALLKANSNDSVLNDLAAFAKLKR